MRGGGTDWCVMKRALHNATVSVLQPCRIEALENRGLLK